MLLDLKAVSSYYIELLTVYKIKKESDLIVRNVFESLKALF